MKSILMSIKPYYGFLIIATMKGWNLAKYGLHEKKVEVRKGVPTSPDWDKKVSLYFSKDKKSLAHIPEEYRGEVAELCGKVVGEFVCDNVICCQAYYDEWGRNHLTNVFSKDIKMTCLSEYELWDYIAGKAVKANEVYDGWLLHISDLKIYDKPKVLSEFRKPRKCAIDCKDCILDAWCVGTKSCDEELTIIRPPQSWCYVKEMEVYVICK